MMKQYIESLKLLYNTEETSVTASDSSNSCVNKSGKAQSKRSDELIDCGISNSKKSYELQTR